MSDKRLTAEEAVEKALLFTFQLSGKDYRKMQTAMSEVAFIRALEQDGYTVTVPTHPHDGYAYDGCECVCCVNVRALAGTMTDKRLPQHLNLGGWHAPGDEPSKCSSCNECNHNREPQR